MTAVLGFVAVATDFGLLLNRKRMVQSAADCAAVAGASELRFAGADGYTTNALGATGAAKAAAAQNGYTDGANNATVTVNNGPTSGPHAGNAGYVEVLVKQYQSTVFMNLFSTHSVPIQARGVAGINGGQGCVYTLSTSGTDINASGSAAVSVPGCTIYDDSTNSSALKTSGSASISANSINISGNYSGSNISSTPKTGTPYVADPLSYLPAPSTASCGASKSYSSSGSLGPGCYAGLITNGNSTVLTLSPGLYVITGNLTVAGGSALSQSVSSGIGESDGITFYVTGVTTVSGGSSMNLSAPTSGTYNGILIFQSRTDTNTVTFSGGSTGNIAGIIYAPAAPLTFTGGSSGNTYLTVVVASVNFSGASTFQDYALFSDSSPLAKITLME